MTTQDRKHIITIAGRPGSGKSTASKGIAKELGYEHFSSGDLFRSIGKERGMELFEANVSAYEQKDIDQIVDTRLQEIGKSQEFVVIDSRMAWHWIPNSFKVYLNLDIQTAAIRILAKLDPKRIESEHIPDDPEKLAKVLQDRLAHEENRYKGLYGVTPFDESNYTLVVDTKKHNHEEVRNIIIKEYKAWLGPQSVNELEKK